MTLTPILSSLMNEFPEIPEEQQELYEHFSVTVDDKQSPLRIDKFLMARLANASRNRIQNAAKAGNILVDGKPAKSSYKIKPGELITIVMAHPPRDTEILAEDIPLQIIYEDKDVILIDKIAGMVVHPAYANYTGTLVNALTYYFDNRSNKDESAGPLLVHRIDKNTSGLMIVAKNELAQTRLAREFFDHTIERKYIALVWGDFDEDEGTIEGHIGRHKKNRKVMTVYPKGDYGKNAITHYKIIERFSYTTLIECKLETGRTHQIRAHLKYIGHPLFNDSTYGGDKIIKGTTFTKYKQFIQNCFKILPRQGLHAQSLGFKHPGNGQSMYFESKMPKDMAEVIEKWRSYAKHKMD